LNDRKKNKSMAMQQEQYGGTGSFILMTISMVFAWISKLTMDQIAFVVSVTSGGLASLSFVLRIIADWRKIKNRNDEGVVEEPEQD
jgi:uncharacterized protein (DUF486 family)